MEIGGVGGLGEGMGDTAGDVRGKDSPRSSLHGKQIESEIGEDNNKSGEAGDTLLLDSKKSEKVI